MRFSFRTSLLALTLISPLSASALKAQSNPGVNQPAMSIEARLRQDLSGIEDVPLEAEIRALGHDATAALIVIADDANAVPFLRLRAITCLSWSSGNRASTYLRNVLRVEQEPMRLRAAIRAYGTREGARAMRAIAAHGQHADGAVREAVYTALLSIQSAASTTAAQRTQVQRTLSRLLASETDAELAQRIRSAP